MWREILGLEKKGTNLVDLIVPRRSFADVILPDDTRRQLYEALTQIDKHRLIFNTWGLGERHPTGLGLVFNFAGPPGTGKTVCAEAVAYALGRKLLRVRYSELESCWVGETGKNVRAVFREAQEQGAVLFFDEADSVASRRFSTIHAGHEREANQTVNILLKELEEHEGVVIFATNMASNFDPAFERRIRTHILFKIPGVSERERIWKVQIHPDKTPLAPDVDFRALAERFEVPGGDIRNAVLKAAQMAAAGEGSDEQKQLHQGHFVAAMEQVLSAKQVMQQNAVDPDYVPWQDAVEGAEQRLEALDADIQACRTELELLGGAQSALSARTAEQLAALESRMDPLQEGLRALEGRTETLTGAVEGLRTELGEGLQGLRRELEESHAGHSSALATWRGDQERALQELGHRLEERYEERLARATLIPLPRAATAGLGVFLAALMLVLGALGGRLLAW